MSYHEYMLTIKKASVGDVDVILDLYAQYDREPDRRPQESTIKDIFYSFDSRADGIFLAKDDISFVGTFSLYICPDLNRSGRPFAVLENVIVSKSYRRKGFGKAMVQEAIKIAKKSNCHKIMLQSGDHRTENHIFYESCGFIGNKRGFVIRFEE